MVDLRSQLLHKSVMDEINRRWMFKTVGAVENIGFQELCESSNKNPEEQKKQFQW